MVTRKTGLHGGRKQKTGRLRAGYAMKPDQQNGIWIVQAHEWGKYVDGLILSFVMAK